MNHPTPTDIAAVVNDVARGNVFDPAEHAQFWDCRIYNGDRSFGEGQGSSAGEAMAYAWIHAHAPDGLSNPEFLEDVPPAVAAEGWRFELTPPSA